MGSGPAGASSPWQSLLYAYHPLEVRLCYPILLCCPRLVRFSFESWLRLLVLAEEEVPVAGPDTSTVPPLLLVRMGWVALVLKALIRGGCPGRFDHAECSAYDRLT